MKQSDRSKEVRAVKERGVVKRSYQRPEIITYHDLKDVTGSQGGSM